MSHYHLRIILFDNLWNLFRKSTNSILYLIFFLTQKSKLKMNGIERVKMWGLEDEE